MLASHRSAWSSFPKADAEGPPGYNATGASRQEQGPTPKDATGEVEVTRPTQEQEQSEVEVTISSRLRRKTRKAKPEDSRPRRKTTAAKPKAVAAETSEPTRSTRSRVT